MSTQENDLVELRFVVLTSHGTKEHKVFVALQADEYDCLADMFRRYNLWWRVSRINTSDPICVRIRPWTYGYVRLRLIFMIRHAKWSAIMRNRMRAGQATELR